jgi:hypothetical protein
MNFDNIIAHYADHATTENGQMPIEVSILCFENEFLNPDVQEELKERQISFPYDFKADDVTLKLDWHSTWNHLGPDSNIRSSNCNALLVRHGSANAAAEFLHKADICNAILFVDMHFAEADVAHVPPRMFPVTFRKYLESLSDQSKEEFIQIVNDLRDASEVFEAFEDAIEWTGQGNRQGIVLVALVLMNKIARNVDIWIASGSRKNSDILRTIGGYAVDRGVAIYDAGGNLSRDGAELIEDRLLKAFKVFSERYMNIDGRLWN